jgi:hypothetical protein
MNMELQRTGASVSAQLQGNEQETAEDWDLVSAQLQGNEQETAENWSLRMKYDCRGMNKKLQEIGSCKKQ